LQGDTSLTRAFISYARVDTYLVKQLVGILDAGGHEPWFDHELMPGQDWKAQLLDAIQRCTVFIYALTPESVESEWCRWEFARAVELCKPIIPILLQANTVLPRSVSRYQYVDFSQGPTAEATARLLGGLANLAVILSPTELPCVPDDPRGLPSRAPLTYNTRGSTSTRPSRSTAVILPPDTSHSDITRPTITLSSPPTLPAAPTLPHRRNKRRWLRAMLLIFVLGMLSGAGSMVYAAKRSSGITPTARPTTLPASTSTPAVSSACNNSQPTRLDVGMQARIAPILGANFHLRVRLAPGLDNEATCRMKSGAVFHITGGPVCADGMVWWKIETSAGCAGWAAESDDVGYYMLPIFPYQ